MKNNLETLHRSVISRFNETRGRFPFVYYIDVEVEPSILPLVELLNSEWTLTTHACGGHWEATPQFQYPYVSFQVFANRAVWRRIVSNTWRALKPELGGTLTITVEDGYKLPESCPNCSCWRIFPRVGETWQWEDTLHIFQNWQEFRQEIDSLVGKTCSALMVEMDKARKNPLSMGKITGGINEGKGRVDGGGGAEGD